MIIYKTSLFTGKVNKMDLDVTDEQLAELRKPLQQRRLIQDIVPQLNADEREFLLSGCTPEEWKATFGEDA